MRPGPAAEQGLACVCTLGGDRARLCLRGSGWCALSGPMEKETSMEAWKCICACVNICVCMYTCAHTKHAKVQMCVHMCAHTYICEHVFISTHTCMHVRYVRVNVCVCLWGERVLNMIDPPQNNFSAFLQQVPHILLTFHFGFVCDCK